MEPSQPTFGKPSLSFPELPVKLFPVIPSALVSAPPAARNRQIESGGRVEDLDAVGYILYRRALPGMRQVNINALERASGDTRGLEVLQR